MNKTGFSLEHSPIDFVLGASIAVPKGVNFIDVSRKPKTLPGVPLPIVPIYGALPQKQFDTIDFIGPKEKIDEIHMAYVHEVFGHVLQLTCSSRGLFAGLPAVEKVGAIPTILTITRQTKGNKIKPPLEVNLAKHNNQIISRCLETYKSGIYKVHDRLNQNVVFLDKKNISLGGLMEAHAFGVQLSIKMPRETKESLFDVIHSVKSAEKLGIFNRYHLEGLFLVLAKNGPKKLKVLWLLLAASPLKPIKVSFDDSIDLENLFIEAVNTTERFLKDLGEIVKYNKILKQIYTPSINLLKVLLCYYEREDIDFDNLYQILRTNFPTLFQLSCSAPNRLYLEGSDEIGSLAIQNEVLNGLMYRCTTECPLYFRGTLKGDKFTHYSQCNNCNGQIGSVGQNRNCKFVEELVDLGLDLPSD